MVTLLKSLRKNRNKKRINNYKVVIVPDNPREEQVQDNTVYLVGTKKFLKWAYLKCPSGCGEVIMLSLNPNSYPSWRVKISRGGLPTFSPSIFKQDGCKSHFWIQKGRVIWCKY